mmetsp:Transcript_20349/g.22610  ORF Transcript_20349/g.22610 Transcript_20349/m.22610 type:complete len:162 (+) Transcript_20349:33-518(+)
MASFIKAFRQLGVREGVFRLLRNASQIPVGKQVGIDNFGNRYYEDKDAVSGRERWVQYASANFTMDASTVPAEWHSWLHHVTDDIPGSFRVQRHVKPRFVQDHQENKTGGGEAYAPHYYLLNEKYHPEDRLTYNAALDSRFNDRQLGNEERDPRSNRNEDM